MDGIILGQYIPGDSLIHRLDPRTKIITVAILVWAVFMLQTLTEYLTFGIMVIALYIFSGVIQSLWKTIRPAIYIIFFTVLLNSLFTPGESVFKLGIINFTREGLTQGMTMGIRLIYLISLSSIVTLTTSPVRMTDGLEALLQPLKKVGLPVSEIAMMMNIALRFVPTFWEEWEKIRKAQISRGADFESWNMANRIRFMTAMLVPLFISAFRRADDLSVAMEARGYVVGATRTSLNVLSMKFADYAVILLITLLSILFIFYRTGLF